MSVAAAEARIPSRRTQRISIVVAGFGQNLVLTTVTTFILLYLLQYAHISTEGMAVVTVVITAAKIFDAIDDPVMGSLIDMTRTRWGKLRPYINVFVNDEDIRYLDDLETPVKDGEIVALIPAVAGG